MPFLVLQPAAPYVLRFQPPVGTVVHYVQTVAMKQTVPGMAKPIVSTTTTPFTYRIVSREGGVTTIETKSGKSRMDLPTGSPLAAMKAKVEGTASDVTTTVKVDEAGNLLDTKIDAQGPNAALIKRLGAGLTKGFQGITYPATPLEVGGTWSTTMDLGPVYETAIGDPATKVQGKATIDYRLASAADGFARTTFGVTGRATVRGKALTMTAVIAGSGESTTDLATGLVRSSATTSDNSMTVKGETMRQHMVTTLKTVDSPKRP